MASVIKTGDNRYRAHVFVGGKPESTFAAFIMSFSLKPCMV
jgi:hypothetical protein